MRIGIDIRELEQATMTGTGRYLSNFLSYVKEHEQTNEYVLFGNQHTDCRIEGLHFKTRIIPERFTLFWDQFILARQIRKEKIELFYSPYFKGPLFSRCKLIVTIHDVFPLLPQAGLGMKSYILKVCYWVMAKRAKLIFTVSQHSKQTIEKYLKVSSDKIKIAYDSVAESLRPLPKDECLARVQTKYQIAGNFILYVGNLKPHKNLVRLIQAYALLTPEIRQSYQLVICGKKDNFFAPLSALVKSKELEQQVLFIDFVGGEDLPQLYSAASVFVFPSLYEGFGLPPLEAMACGTAVVSSDIAPFTEILDKAAVLVDPRQEQQITQALLRLLTDRELASEMVKKGLQRAQQFSIETEANRILEAFVAE